MGRVFEQTKKTNEDRKPPLVSVGSTWKSTSASPVGMGFAVRSLSTALSSLAASAISTSVTPTVGTSTSSSLRAPEWNDTRPAVHSLPAPMLLPGSWLLLEKGSQMRLRERGRRERFPHPVSYAAQTLLTSVFATTMRATLEGIWRRCHRQTLNPKS